MRMVSARRFLMVVVAVTALVGSAYLARSYLVGLSFVVRAADMDGTIRTVANFAARPVTERRIDIEATTSGNGGTTIAARMYSPRGRSRRAVLLVSGLHPDGIDEPRLTGLARQLAASGLVVVTPDVRELSLLEIGPTVTDQIEAAALWLSDLPHALSVAVDDRRIGLMGISFSGGLSIVAAGRPALRDRVAYVFSLGGHDDLPRVLRYLCSGTVPRPSGQIPLKPGVSTDDEDPRQLTPTLPPPHDYGVAIFLLGVAHRLVPAPQLETLRDAVRRFLQASTRDRTDKARADEEFAALKKLATMVPEPSATLLRYLNDRDTVHLGARLLPYIELFGGAPSLSPSRSPKPSSPVFLLHGRDDNVIPAIESEYLANELGGQVPVRLLLSDLISHAATERAPRPREITELASFWGDLLGQ
jgi:pimeloyl-ACP methyl ester carboxylesterase